MAYSQSVRETMSPMPDRESIEREYRELSARVTYALIDGLAVDPEDRRRLEELSEWRVKLAAPDFLAYAAA